MWFERVYEWTIDHNRYMHVLGFDFLSSYCTSANTHDGGQHTPTYFVCISSLLIRTINSIMHTCCCRCRVVSVGMLRPLSAHRYSQFVTVAARTWHLRELHEWEGKKNKKVNRTNKEHHTNIQENAHTDYTRTRTINHTKRKTYIVKHRHAHAHAYTHKETDRKTDRKTDSKTARQEDRQTDSRF